MPTVVPVAPTSIGTKPAPVADIRWMSLQRDLPREHGFEPLHLEGTIPIELSRTLHRAEPALFSTFGKSYGHWFDGDGAVSATVTN